MVLGRVRKSRKKRSIDIFLPLPSCCLWLHNQHDTILLEVSSKYVQVFFNIMTTTFSSFCDESPHFQLLTAILVQHLGHVVH
jgi:hypothetical protein